MAAVVDMAAERAEECAREHGVPRFYASIDAALEEAELDVVDVCTPPTTHKDLILKAVRKGVNVFVEKPLTTSYADAVEVLKRAEERGVKLGVSNTYFFAPAVQKALRMAESVEVRRADVVVHAPEGVALAENPGWLEDLPGGALGEVLPHPIYLLQAFVGRLEVVDARAAKLSGSRWMPYDELWAALRGERGDGTITISYNAARFDLFVIAQGARGTLVVHPAKALARLDASWRYLRNALGALPYLTLGLDAALGRARGDWLVGNFKAFLDHLRGGRYFSAEELLNQVEVYEDILSRLGAP